MGIDFYGKTRREMRIPIEAVTSNRTLTQNDNGKLFTNRGATGSVTFTLPTPGAAYKGMFFDFFVVADYALVLSATEGIVADDNNTADAVSYATADEMVGGSFRAVCDGTSWLVIAAAYDTMTQTIADS